MKSLVVKRSVVIGGHKTSVSLEDAFWQGLKEIAHSQQCTLSLLVSEIDTRRSQGNLSSAIRLFVLDSVRMRVPMFAGIGTGNGNGIGVGYGANAEELAGKPA